MSDFSFRYGDDDSSDVVQLDPSTSNSPTPGTSGLKNSTMINIDHRRYILHIRQITLYYSGGGSANPSLGRTLKLFYILGQTI